MVEAASKYIDHAEQICSVVDGLTVKPVDIKIVGIIGAGLMGGGIGMCCAEVGIKVNMFDINEEALKKGMGVITSNFKRSKRLSEEQKTQYIGNMSGTVNMADLADCDLVVEAVFEEMSIKKDIFTKLDKVCKPGAFLCTNTSYLSIDEIASVTSRPEFVMGTHFFSPANVMKLLENVKGSKTSEVTIASMMAWGKRIGKTCILVGNCHGFVGNRMVQFYSGSARKMLDMGLLPEHVDGAAGKFGMKMGPIAMSDLVGLDLGIQAVKKAGQYDPEKVIDHALIHAGRLGQKNLKGFYDYDESRKSKPSPVVAEILKQVMKNKGSKAIQLNEEQVMEYLLFPMINEAFNILSEGIAQRPSDIDVCYCNGYSFPRKRGGPMYYADTVGLTRVKSVLETMGVKVAPLLAEIAASGKTLAEYWTAKTSPSSKL